MLFHLYLVFVFSKGSYSYPYVLNLCQKSRTISSCDQRQFAGQYFFNSKTGRCEPITMLDSDGRPCNLDSDIFPSLARCQILCQYGRNDKYGSQPCGAARCHSEAQCSSNSDGGVICACKPGFTGDGYTSCVVDHQQSNEVDPQSSFVVRPCDRITCHSNAQCLINDGQAKCACRSGFSGDGYSSCVAVPKLYSQPVAPCERITCHSNARCVVNDGRASCACRSGYSGDGYSSCVPARELYPQSVTPCERITCHSNARCVVSDGRAGCTCRSGYSGDGYISCVIKQETRPRVVLQPVARPCDVQLCHSNAQCSVVDGRAACSCKSGFTGDGYSACVVDQQRPVVAQISTQPRCSHLVCGRRAECIRTAVQDYECRCRQGYTGNGHQCVMQGVRARLNSYSSDVLGRRDCSMIRCDPNARCIDQDGKAYCRCNDGYAGSGQFCTSDPNSCYDRFDSRYGEQCGEYSYTKFFYHDPASGRCRMFWYGKCMDGITSRNIFSDEHSCSSLCSTTGSPIWAAPYRPQAYDYGPYSTETCLLPPKEGYWCGSQASGKFYYFDKDSQICRPFYYQGCDGNENRFSSMQECNDRCSGHGLSASVINLPSNCMIPVDYGFQSSGCVRSARYYYDQGTERCRKFEYTGCRGNGNNFGSFRECTQLCRKADHGSRYLRSPTYATHGLDGDPCFLPKNTGSCSSPQKMYYYESEMDDCQEFFYSGCGGNGNKFENYEQCLNKCGNRRK